MTKAAQQSALRPQPKKIHKCYKGVDDVKNFLLPIRVFLDWQGVNLPQAAISKKYKLKFCAVFFVFRILIVVNTVYAGNQPAISVNYR